MDYISTNCGMRTLVHVAKPSLGLSISGIVRSQRCLKDLQQKCQEACPHFSYLFAQSTNLESISSSVENTVKQYLITFPFPSVHSMIASVCFHNTVTLLIHSAARRHTSGIAGLELCIMQCLRQTETVINTFQGYLK